MWYAHNWQEVFIKRLLSFWYVMLYAGVFAMGKIDTAYIVILVSETADAKTLTALAKDGGKTIRHFSTAALYQ